MTKQKQVDISEDVQTLPCNSCVTAPQHRNEKSIDKTAEWKWPVRSVNSFLRLLWSHQSSPATCIHFNNVWPTKSPLYTWGTYIQDFTVIISGKQSLLKTDKWLITDTNICAICAMFLRMFLTKCSMIHYKLLSLSAAIITLLSSRYSAVSEWAVFYVPTNTV